MSVPKKPKRRHRNPYKKLHAKLVDFAEHASLDPELVARNEYARMENMFLRGMFFQTRGSLHLSSAEKVFLADAAINMRGRTRVKASLLTPAQIVRYSKKSAGEKYVSLYPKRTCIQRNTRESKESILRSIVDEHPCWKKKQVLEEMQKFFENITYRTVYDMLYDMGFWDCQSRKRKGIPWLVFLARFENVTWAGDFFSVEVWTDDGQITYYVFFFIHLATQRVVIAGISASATAKWVMNILKGWSDSESPFGKDARFLIRDRDRRYTAQVDWYFMQIGLMPKVISPGAPVMNCYAEQFVKKIKHECLSHCHFFSEQALKNTIYAYVEYYHNQRPNTKFNGGCIIEDETHNRTEGEIVRQTSIPGVLSYYCRRPNG